MAKLALSVLILLAAAVAWAAEPAKGDRLFPQRADPGNKKQYAMQILNSESRPPDGKTADPTAQFYEFDPLAGLSGILRKPYIPPSVSMFKKMLRWMPERSSTSVSDDGGPDTAVARFRVDKCAVQIDRNRAECIMFVRPDSGKLDLTPDAGISGVPMCFSRVLAPELLKGAKANHMNDVDLGGGDRFVFWWITGVKLPSDFDHDAGIELSWTNSCLCIQLVCESSDPLVRGIPIFAPPATPSTQETRLDEASWPAEAKREVTLQYRAKEWLSLVRKELQSSALKFPVLGCVDKSFVFGRPLYDDKLGTLPLHVTFVCDRNVTTNDAGNAPFSLLPFDGATVNKDGILLRIYVTELALPGKHQGDYPLGTAGLSGELHLVYDVQTSPPDAKLDAEIKTVIEKMLPQLQQDLAKVK